MPLSGKLPNPSSGFSLLLTPSSYFALLAVTLILFCARWYNQGCKSSGDGSRESRTMPSEKDGTGVLQQRRGVGPPERITGDIQSPSAPSLPPISDATGAVLSHQYTISFPDNSGTGPHTHVTQNHEAPQHHPRPTFQQSHTSTYYQNTANPYTFRPNWSSTPSTGQTTRNPYPAAVDDTNDDFNTSSMGQYPNSFNPPSHNVHPPVEPALHAEPVNPGVYREFNPTAQHYDYSLPPVRKQRESLQVFRGVGQEKGRTWRRKALEYS